MSIVKLTDQLSLVNTSNFPYGKYTFEKFNQVQSRVFEIYDKDCNCVIAAPTSVGKTVCAEMFMSSEVRLRGGKAIYLAPLKALAKEKIDDWTSKNSIFSDLKISICTGDYRLTESRKKELEEADIIIMTSEMLNSRCRNLYSENNEFLKNCGTLIVDESHLLTVPSRGDHLEVGLMKYAKIAKDPRIVFLSATMPNVDQIANWLGCSLVRKDTYLIESNYRPCPLEIHYEEYENSQYYELTEDYKVSKAIDVVREYPNDKFLIFVHSKVTGESICSALKERNVECEFHSADLDKNKRHQVEQKFKNGNLRIIVATSTLAWGCYKHGSRVIMPNGSLKDISDIQVGDELLCPVENNFAPRKVLRTKSFKSQKGYFVKLECGDSMVVSEDHIFLAAKDREIADWTDVSLLSRGDFIAVPANLGLWSKKIEKYDDFWYLAGFAFGDGCLVSCGKHADDTDKFLLDLCIGKDNDFSKKILDKFNKKFKCNLLITKDQNLVLHLRTKKKTIVDQFKDVLPVGRKNGTNDLPFQIYGSQIKVASFLRGLFDADGGTENHSNENISVGLSNISKKAIESVRVLLLGFGIRSSFGRKKMKPSVINGRIQLPVRKYSYRLRIFGEKNLALFQKHIGFDNFKKNKKLKKYLKTKNFGFSKDLIPARKLLKDHAETNNLTYKDFRNITNTDMYNSIHNQDINRLTVDKLLNHTKKRSELNDFVEKPYYWSRIKEIRKNKGGLFREIELEDPHSYVGCGAISHNCNFPARRVIITGVHRGRTEVETYDIFQMAGRAGRPGYDPRGDVHILIPDKDAYYHIDRLSEPKNIESQLLNYVGDEENPRYKTLAFHIVSEIHHGQITNLEELHKWYEQSLSYFQYHELDEAVADKIIDLLLINSVIKEVEGNYEVTSIGKVSSILYYSPFDVADLRRNFREIFQNQKHNIDMALALALGNVDSLRVGYVTKAEKDEMEKFYNEVRKAYGERFTDPAIKGAYIYYCLLRGNSLGPFNALGRTLQMDFDRLSTVLNLLDSMAAKWNKKDFFSEISLRIAYGVRPELIELCKLPNIGKVRAEKLYAAGIKKPFDIIKNVHLVKRILNMKEEKIIEIINFVKK
jgi:replicative superfamily II helicase